jgi:hypothetical protein
MYRVHGGRDRPRCGLLLPPALTASRPWCPALSFESETQVMVSCPDEGALVKTGPDGDPAGMRCAVPIWRTADAVEQGILMRAAAGCNAPRGRPSLESGLCDASLRCASALMKQALKRTPPAPA